MTTAGTQEKERLQALEDQLEEWQRQALAHVEDAPSSPGIDGAFRERFETTRKRLFSLNDQLHTEDFDPAALAEIRDIILKGLQAQEESDESRPLDALDDFLVRAEAIRHIVRDAIDGHIDGAGEDARAIMARLNEWLPRMKQKDLADLVGRSPRQVQRWAREGGAPTRRLQLVARMVALLHRGWTEDGVVAWFDRPRRDLGGKRPRDLLDDASYERELLTVVRQGRAQHG